MPPWGQAFFTLSLGIGAMTIFGSYIDKQRSLTGESIHIMLLDTFVALMAGLIIFPACFAFDVDAGSGPASCSSPFQRVQQYARRPAVGNALLYLHELRGPHHGHRRAGKHRAYGIDVLKWTRKKAVTVNFVLVFLLSLPAPSASTCCPASSLRPRLHDPRSGRLHRQQQPAAPRSMVFLFFCCYKRGWGWDNFIAEADTGKGLMFPKGLRLYVKYVLPFIVFFVFVQGYIDKFFK